MLRLFAQGGVSCSGREDSELETLVPRKRLRQGLHWPRRLLEITAKYSPQDPNPSLGYQSTSALAVSECWKEGHIRVQTPGISLPGLWFLHRGWKFQKRRLMLLIPSQT